MHEHNKHTDCSSMRLVDGRCTELSWGGQDPKTAETCPSGSATSGYGSDLALGWHCGKPLQVKKHLGRLREENVRRAYGAFAAFLGRCRGCYCPYRADDVSHVIPPGTACSCLFLPGIVYS